MSRNNNDVLVPGAKGALDKFKLEVADELGLIDKLKNKNGDWGDMTTRDVGKIGGNMVKKMTEMAEKDMAGDQPDK